MNTTTLIACLLVAAPAAFGQGVYRCGNSYSQLACAQGRLVEVDDSRSAAQQAEARRVAAEERSLAAQMQRDRLAAEAAQAPRIVMLPPRPLRVARDAGDQRPPKKSKARPAARSNAGLSDPIIVAPAPPRRRAARA